MGQAYTTSGIIFNDNSTGTVVDSLGVVSATNFNNYSSLYLPELPDISGTAWADIGSCTMNIVGTRNANVILGINDAGNTNGQTGTIRMVLGTAIMDSTLYFTTVDTSRTLINFGTITAGTNVFKLQGAMSGTNNAIQHGGRYLQMFYMVLGK